MVLLKKTFGETTRRDVMSRYSLEKCPYSLNA